MTTGRQLLQLATHYLDPVLRADVDTLVLGCTHYPLLTGMISLVVGDGRDAGEQRRGDGQGRLPGARSGPASTATRGRRRRRVHRFLGDRRPRAVRPARPALPRPGDRHGHGSWREPHEAHRPRLLRHLPRPRLALLGLPRRARRLPAAWSTSAPARSARCSARSTCSRSTPSTSATCTPTTALDLVGLLLRPPLPPGRPAAAAAGATARPGSRDRLCQRRSRRRRRPARRGLRLPRGRAGRAASGSARSRCTTRAWTTPSSATACGSRPAAARWSTPATPPAATRWSSSPADATLFLCEARWPDAPGAARPGST